MAAQGSTCFFAIAVHQVQHAGGNARLQRQITQTRGSHGRQLAHLQHGGVAKGQAGCNFPRGRHKGHVPRADERTHTGGVKQRVVEVRLGRVSVAVYAGAHLGEVIEVVCCAGDELLAGLCDDLAAVVGLGLRNFGHVRGNQITQLANEFGALWCGHAGPLREGFFGGRNGGVDFCIAT